MPPIPPVPATWLVDLINEFGARPRAAAGASGAPYPPPAELGEADSITLADRWWPVFGEPDPAARAQALNELLERAQLTPTVDPTGEIGWSTTHTTALERFSAGCAATVVEAVRAGGWQRLGSCDGQDCVDVYFDTAGRGRRRYCSPTCLNRARIRSYRARQQK